MPRAFLITNKRYNSVVDYEECYASRDPSPERAVCTADGPLYVDDSAEDSGHSADSYPLFQPTSPKSPAHESNGPSSPQNAQDLTIPISKVAPTGQQCIISCYTNTDILTVVQQLMRQTNYSLNKPSIKVFHSSAVPLIPHQKLLPKTPSVSPPLSTVETHTCPECDKRYSTSSNLARHRQTHRSVTDKKARKCPHCDKIYVSVPAYSMHVRTHSQGCQCPYCGKCFSRPWLLQGHIRTHTGEKPFTCPVCKKAFADKSNLRAHVQTHSDSKPYVCHRCGKAFALKSYLYKHEESSCMRLHRQIDKEGGENFKTEINSPIVEAR